MFDVVALGESLIDFTPNGTNAQGMPVWAAKQHSSEKSAKTDLAIFSARPLWKAALMCPVW